MNSIIVFLMLHAPVIELPKQIVGKPNAFITIPAKTDPGSIVKWFTPDQGLNIFPVDLLKDTRTLVVTGPEGVFRIYAYTADATGPSDPALCMVLIGDHPQPDNPPGPGPAVVSDIAIAAKKEDPEAVKWLSQFYDELAKESQKPEYETLADVFRAAKVAIDKQFKPDELKELRSVIGKRLNSVLPTENKGLDKATRDLLTKEFLKVSKELK